MYYKKYQFNDYAIDLQEGGQPPFRPIYNLLQDKFIALKECIDESLARNNIQCSKSLKRVLILFVKKIFSFLQM